MVFSSFNRKLPQISIFHNPASPPSTKALALLRSALTHPYPPSAPAAPPLEFDLEVVEGTPPTPDQFRTILGYLRSPPASNSHPSSSSSSHSSPPSSQPSSSHPPPTLAAFLSAHPSAPLPAEAPRTPQTLTALAAQNPAALRWPVVVDWIGGRASVGDVEGVRGILEAVRRARDGEGGGEGEGVDKARGWFS
ncbi:hypothetical protein BV22DRAFT_654098 [Leucogyrophana mollusca]|uniref:Uncharacterized protein n=1 Tax=Leucogyrophana mollusca TaxID=85980 RepID=A0ACB8B9W8_9AGAM|nr:hypothetical protein BV22DRAFT_654098 [Leucogyrophana mollusca]